MNKYTIILILSILIAFIQFGTSCAGIKDKTIEKSINDYNYEAQIRANKLYSEYLLAF